MFNNEIADAVMQKIDDIGKRMGVDRESGMTTEQIIEKYRTDGFDQALSGAMHEVEEFRKFVVTTAQEFLESPANAVSVLIELGYMLREEELQRERAASVASVALASGIEEAVGC